MNAKFDILFISLFELKYSQRDSRFSQRSGGGFRSARMRHCVVRLMVPYLSLKGRKPFTQGHSVMSGKT